ncbi:hypothetical protein C0992_004384 [Termitomyces sp. T32_za158]|nr:hypothetical protein C0992_004384 [Termitomyces sp. T32_za158]
MTAITRNLPSFVRDLGVSIVGQKCYTSLVENLAITDVPCLKYALSKALGVGIVIGGSIMKIPQIILILNAHSARGLSLPAYILETLSYAITLFYSFRHTFPFSTYGENLFLTLQNTLITLLILLFSRPSPALSLALGVLVALTAFLTLSTLPLRTLALCQTLTLPLALLAKLPQIKQNARARSTGHLSAFAVLSQIAGCAARLFTTAAELGDRIVLAGFGVALALNVVLGVQMWVYWPRGREVGEEGEGENQSGIEMRVRTRESGDEDAHAPPRLATATPPPRSSSAAGSRKWARKVD